MAAPTPPPRRVAHARDLLLVVALAAFVCGGATTLAGLVPSAAPSTASPGTTPRPALAPLTLVTEVTVQPQTALQHNRDRDGWGVREGEEDAREFLIQAAAWRHRGFLWQAAASRYQRAASK
jgi:hypothetical protein